MRSAVLYAGRFAGRTHDTMDSLVRQLLARPEERGAFYANSPEGAAPLLRQTIERLDPTARETTPGRAWTLSNGATVEIRAQDGRTT